VSPSSVRAFLGSVFEIDLRSLALFRMALAITVITDLTMRASDLRAFYAADGTMPVALARELYDFRVDLSLFSWLASWPQLQLAAVGLAIALAVVLGLGLYPRRAALLLWLMLMALQDRNPLINYSADRYMLVLLFWSLFLPTGARWSVRPDPARPSRLRSWAGAGLLIQIASVYWMTGLRKTGPEWTDGSALWFALNIDMYVTSFGIWLRDQSSWIAALSHVTKWGQLLVPCLAFCPWPRGALRAAAVIFFLSFHAGLQTSMSIGVFQMVGASAWLAFVPGSVWDRTSMRGRPQHESGRLAARPLWLDRATIVPLLLVVSYLASTALGAARGGTEVRPPAFLHAAAGMLRLRQDWRMFARVTRQDSWYVMHGELEDGSNVDVLRGEPLSWTKPVLVSSAQRSFRWREYLLRGVDRASRGSPRLAPVLPALTDYLCREWNESHASPRRIHSLRIIAMIEQTSRDSVTPAKAYEVTRATCP
jgi:hypothetical protein